MHNVDIVDTPSTRTSVIPLPNRRPPTLPMNTPTSTTAAHRAASHPSGDNVDIVDTRPTPRPVAAVPRGRPGGMSVPRPMPIPTKLSRPPQPVVGDGPSGPDAGRVRSLPETWRRTLTSRAGTAGARPGTRPG